jgi:hypothetical protein
MTVEQALVLKVGAAEAVLAQLVALLGLSLLLPVVTEQLVFLAL